MIPQEFHFLRPWMFVGLIPLALTLLHVYRQAGTVSRWRSLIDPQLLRFQLGETQQRRSRTAILLYLLAGTLVVLALAGPVWERQPTPLFRDQSALVVILDASPSMNVEDVSPSRMVLARFKTRDILARSRDLQVGLVAFGAAPYVISPLTDDIHTISNMVPAIDPSIIPVAGSDLSGALTRAGELIATGLSRVADGLQATELAAWTSVTRTVFNLHEFIARN